MGEGKNNNNGTNDNEGDGSNNNKKEMKWNLGHLFIAQGIDSSYLAVASLILLDQLQKVALPLFHNVQFLHCMGKDHCIQRLLTMLALGM